MTPAERAELERAVLPVLKQALAMEPEQREATFGVLCAAIASADGLEAFRAIVRSAVAKVEARMAARI